MRIDDVLRGMHLSRELGWFQYPVAVARLSTPSSAVVFGYLCFRMRERGEWVSPTRKEIETATGVQVRTQQNCIKRLAALGLVEVEEYGGFVRYRVPDVTPEKSSEGVKKVPGGGENISGGGGKKFRSTPTLERTTKNIKKNTRSRSAPPRAEDWLESDDSADLERLYPALDGKRGRPLWSDVVEEALSHDAAKKYSNPTAYIRNWARRTHDQTMENLRRSEPALFRLFSEQQDKATAERKREMAARRRKGTARPKMDPAPTPGKVEPEKPPQNENEELFAEKPETASGKRDVVREAMARLKAKAGE